MDEPQGWWDRLGGRYAVTLPAWIFTLIGGSVAAFAWIPGDLNDRPLEWVALSIIAQLIVGVVLLAARMTYLSARPRPSRTLALIVTLLVAGWLRGAFLSWAGQRAGLVEDGYIIERAAGTAIAFTVWFCLATLIVDDHRRYRIAVAQLRAATAREQMLAEQATDVIGTFRATVVAETQDAIRAGLQSASAVSSDPAIAAASLHRTVDEVIRPISRELEVRAIGDAAILADATEASTDSRVPLRTYVAGTFTARPFAPLVTPAVVIATPLVVIMHVLGPVIGALIVLSSGVLVGVLLFLIQRPVMRAIPHWSTAHSAGVVIASWLGVTALVALFIGLVAPLCGYPASGWWVNGVPSAATASVFGLLELAVTTMVAAAVEGSVEQQHRSTQKQLHTTLQSVEWAAARLRQRAWSEQRSFGRLLHGTVQAMMVSAAIRMSDQTPQEAEETIETLTTHLRYALGQGSQVPWRQEVSNLQEMWSGAIDLSITITPETQAALDLDALAGNSLFQVMSEAVTNAVRHGDADTVRITVEAQDDCVVVTVMNDGNPIAPPGSEGMGSRIFDANCIDWDLRVDRVTSLTARIACGQPLAVSG